MSGAAQAGDSTSPTSVIEWTIRPGRFNCNELSPLDGPTLAAHMHNLPESCYVSSPFARVRLVAQQVSRSLCQFGYVGPFDANDTADMGLYNDYAHIMVWIKAPLPLKDSRGHPFKEISLTTTLPASDMPLCLNTIARNISSTHETAEIITLRAILSTYQNDPLFSKSLRERNAMDALQLDSVNSQGTLFDTYSLKRPNDLVFHFPKHAAATHGSDLEIWCNQEFISSTCGYFKDMIQFERASDDDEDGGSDEGTVLEETIRQSSVRNSTTDDSDEEQDQQALERLDRRKKPKKLLKINITGHSYTCYRALIQYLYDPRPMRFNTIKSARTEDYVVPRTSRPSPKSMYRLANELQIPAVKLMALDAYKKQISGDNLNTELFSQFSTTYEEVREALLDYTLKNAEAIRGSKKRKL